jgi:hypothetical protein
LDFAEPTRKWAKRSQGRSGYQTGAHRFFFTEEAGPEALTGSARVMFSEGNFGQRRFCGCFRELGVRFGLQATDLLIAVQKPSGLSKKKQRFALVTFKSAQSARCCFVRSATAWSSGDRGIDSFTVGSVEPTDAICSGTPVLKERMFIFTMDVGLLEAATVLRDTTAGVAY